MRLSKRVPGLAWAAIFGLALATPLAIAWAAQHGEEKIVYGPNYGNDRAEIEDLMSRYLYAFDWQDGDAYAATFTEDGILDFAGGVEQGHAELKKVMDDMAVREKAKADASFPYHRQRVRHYVTNLVLEIDGDTARSTSYWWEFNNDARAGRPYLGTYGHYEDELKKVDGRWLFARRKIYNEENPNMRATDANPVYRPRRES
ncbi:nuclear transport factor 2 family protein [Croceibacterium aestuarii]|uniref:nuclear transport factor 2 family protein n=1 Tax=Croceibacterium aestuarii TaxID=3064139 RepID=UPI00272E4BD7|nr:nuclear transport factor 2 family protein [Croceibacterium sp. D39]